MSEAELFISTIENFNNTDPWKLYDWRKIPRGITVMHNRITNYLYEHEEMPHSITELKEWEEEYFK